MTYPINPHALTFCCAPRTAHFLTRREGFEDDIMKIIRVAIAFHNLYAFILLTSTIVELIRIIRLFITLWTHFEPTKLKTPT